MHKYPKLLIVLCSVVLAYVCYYMGWFESMGTILNGHGYISVFLGGLLFSWGFTTAFAIGIFVAMADHVDPVIAAVIAGFGAFLVDFLIFEIVRFPVFHDEIHKLRTSRVYLWMHALFVRSHLPRAVQLSVLWLAAGFIIASPLPDELGIALISGVTSINRRAFLALCFACNTAGILIILLGARTAGL